MLKGGRGRRGFTLLETVVTVGIVATLAAVVYPQVVKQMDTADPTRVAEDLKSLQTAIETFSINVRPHQPGDIADLVNAIKSTDLNVLGAAFDAGADVPRWKGPYVGLSVVDAALATDIAVTTGFEGQILNGFVLFDIDPGTPENKGGDVVSNAANAEYVVIQIDNLTGAAFNAINLLIDGPVEDSPTERRWLGRLRCPNPVAALDPVDTDACLMAYFLVTPLKR